MATTLWSDFVVRDSGGVKIVSKCEVTSQSRNGNTQSYTIKISMNRTSSQAWSNNRWACKVTVGGKVFASNLTIKPKTSGVIGTTVYTGTTSGSISVDGDTGSSSVYVEYWDTGFSTSLTGTKMNTNSANISWNSLPKVSLAVNSYTHNSAELRYTYSNIAPSKVDIYVNDSFNKTVKSTPFSITGLSPSTSYTIKGYGYANGGYGSAGTSATFTTFPAPVTINSISVSDIQPFQASVSTKVSNTANVSSVEYAILNAEGSVVTSSTSSSLSWTATGLTPETQYRFRVRVKTVTSNVWSEYSYSAYFYTIADQASIFIKNDTIWQKGKAYIKIDGVWTPAKKIYIKKDNAWIQGTNN